MNWLKGALTVALGGALAVLIGALTASDIFQLYYFWTSVWVLASTALVILAVRLAVGQRTTDGRWKLESAVPADAAYARFTLTTFASRFARPETLRRLVGDLISPSGSAGRVSERFTLDRARVIVETTRVVHRDQSASEIEVVLPVANVPKQVVVDGFSLHVDGAAISTLSHIESQGAIVACLTALYQQLTATPRPGPHQANTDPTSDPLWADIVATAISDEPCELDEVDKLLNRLEARIGPTRARQMSVEYRGLRDLIPFASRYYLIFAALPPSQQSRSRLTSTRTVKQREVVNRRRDRLRVVLGLEIRDFVLPLLAATETASYHAHVQAPPGMYVYDAQFVPYVFRVAARAEAAPDRPRQSGPLAEVCDSHGFDYVHVYGRELDSQQFDLKADGTVAAEQLGRQRITLGVHIRFRERPPGILLVVFLLASFLALLVVGVGHFHDDVFGRNSATVTTATSANPSPGPSLPATTPVAERPAANQAGVRSASVAPPGTASNGSAATAVDDGSVGTTRLPTSITLLFGIPAILAGWLATRITDDVLRRISLSTGALMIWFITNGAAAGLLAAFKTLQAKDTSLGLGVAHLTHVGWGAIVLSALMNSLVTLIVLLSRSNRYLKRLGKGRAVSSVKGQHT